MRHLVVRGAWLQVPYQDSRGKWRYSTTIKGEVVPLEVPIQTLAPYIASGHVRPITDDEAVRLPRAQDPRHNLLLG